MANQTKKADEKANAKANVPKKPTDDDDVVGKAYDSRLMRRLLTYLAPYKLQTGLSALAILLKAGSDVLGPFLVKIAVDRYMTAVPYNQLSWLARQLSATPAPRHHRVRPPLPRRPLALLPPRAPPKPTSCSGPARKSCSTCAARSSPTIQRMQPAFFDRNPRRPASSPASPPTSTPINEMFTAGVLAIFEDVFVLLFIVLIMLRMSWPLALLTLAVIPAILYITGIFRRHVRDSYRRIRSAIARINAYMQEHVSGMSVIQLFNREDRAYDDFAAINRQHMDAFKDAILAYALYYPPSNSSPPSPSPSSSGAAASPLSTAPSPSASSSPSSSTPSASSAPSWT